MCGRFTLKTPVANWLADLFPNWHEGVAFANENVPIELTRARYNIAPSQSILVFHVDSDGQLRLEGIRWGLLPSWADALSVGYNMINARSESIADKPSFRPSLVDKRCVILADGYYEWKKLTSKIKEPFWIHRPGEAVFAMAGLWAENFKIRVPDSKGNSIRSATIITTPSNSDTASVHDRMPAIFFDAEQISRWLAPELNQKQHSNQLLEQLKPSADGSLIIRRVSTAVNTPKNDSESLICPAV